MRILNASLFADLIAAHRRGEQDNSLQIFTLLVYMKWMKKTAFCSAVSRGSRRSRLKRRSCADAIVPTMIIGLCLHFLRPQRSDYGTAGEGLSNCEIAV